MSPKSKIGDTNSSHPNSQEQSEFEKYDLPLEAAGRFSPYLLDHFAHTALGRGPGYSEHTDQWEEDVQREKPADPGLLAGIIYYYGKKDEDGNHTPRRSYDASAPFQLLRQLAAAAHNSSFESRWMQSWERVEAALEALFYMDESNTHILGTHYPEGSGFSGDKDNLYGILKAATRDHQVGSNRVRSAMISAIGHHMNFILINADDWNYENGFQKLAEVLTDLILSSDTSLLHAGRKGMYCTFYIMLNFLQSRDPFEVLVEAVLRSAKAHAEEVNDNVELTRFWGLSAGNLAGTLQMVLIKVNREDMKDSDVVSTWFSRIGTVASELAPKGWGVLASIVTQIGTEVIQGMEEASEEEQTNATRKAAGRIEDIMIEIGREVIEDIDQWRVYTDAVTTGSRKARKFFGHHF